MTVNYQQIIDEYKQTDFNHRMNIYLAYPQLRSKFMSIDRENLKIDIAAGVRLKKPSLSARMSVLFHLATSSIKRLIGIY